MKQRLIIKPPSLPIHASILPPASKSISNRLLILQSIFPGNIEIQNLSEAQDSLLLRKLLGDISNHHDNNIALVLDCENAGTVCRFLTALLAITKGVYIIDGSPRMKERPIAPLVDALKSIGATIEYIEKQAYLPIKIIGGELTKGNITLDASLSSQFVSALLMILPKLKQGTQLIYQSPVSTPYIYMTLKLMQDMGMKFELDNNSISCNLNLIKPSVFFVETDWSSAAYWYQMVAFSPGSKVYIKGLKADSLQGDSKLMEVFETLGVKSVFDENGLHLQHTGEVQENEVYEMGDFPDIVPSIAVTCAALNITASINGIAHLRQKESDRVKALVKEISKFHCNIKATLNSILITSSQHKFTKPLSFETYNDHRIAMSMAPLALLFEEVEIQDAEVVKKSYPHFWSDLKKAGFSLKG